MDIIIKSDDPQSINVEEIKEVLEDTGYYVGIVTVTDRRGITWSSTRKGD